MKKVIVRRWGLQKRPDGVIHFLVAGIREIATLCGVDLCLSKYKQVDLNSTYPLTGRKITRYVVQGLQLQEGMCKRCLKVLADYTLCSPVWERTATVEHSCDFHEFASLVIRSNSSSKRVCVFSGGANSSSQIRNLHSPEVYTLIEISNASPTACKVWVRRENLVDMCKFIRSCYSGWIIDHATDGFSTLQMSADLMVVIKGPPLKYLMFSVPNSNHLQVIEELKAVGHSGVSLEPAQIQHIYMTVSEPQK